MSNILSASSRTMKVILLRFVTLPELAATNHEHVTTSDEGYEVRGELTCQHVYHSTRSTHDDLSSSLQLSDLLRYSRPPVHTDSPQIGPLSKLLTLLPYLHTQLPGRGHQDGDWTVSLF